MQVKQQKHKIVCTVFLLVLLQFQKLPLDCPSLLKRLKCCHKQSPNPLPNGITAHLTTHLALSQTFRFITQIHHVKNNKPKAEMIMTENQKTKIAYMAIPPKAFLLAEIARTYPISAETIPTTCYPSTFISRKQRNQNAYWESSEVERTFEGRRLEQSQSRMGRTSSYWKGHSKLSGSSDP
ncbi:UDP-N-acetylglucosamine--N-acetylmuramyl-(pentapeptide) pyrophosphoryl-undecaprenol N-acetylglucosaminetransferase [Striga asiatica]|uniref:UDP-N-acetylglucosamine--N-acetylmuramyl-(Pentapeptide) pyrophosphoryl-undecaprenol N-acetylglucosaminetransferase n=1 Tax=Striga asiatica TaxID=4170 RepID=A0A5A7Q8E7_STRAF|nr:UDP-N-acetylglucosamine--N-acetylmuramyl-(pentapeptide) pyrophosphoryl-undecaprenol N-acetylglucosaminetransferase [Striga asiatica]